MSDVATAVFAIGFTRKNSQINDLEACTLQWRLDDGSVDIESPEWREIKERIS